MTGVVASPPLSQVAVLLEMARSQVRVVLTRPMNVATGIVAPLMFLCLLVLPRVERLDGRHATEVFTGVLLASLWAASLWSGAGIIRRERWAGTLGASMTGRVSPLTVLVGKTFGSVVYDVVLIALSTTVFYLAARVPLHVEHPFAFALGLVAVLVCGVASSLMIGGLLVLSRHAFQLTAALGTPIMLLGGTVIPHRYLPEWCADLGNVVNLAWLQRFLASTATGSPDWVQLALALAISTGYAAVGAAALSVLLRRAKQEATLELV